MFELVLRRLAWEILAGVGLWFVGRVLFVCVAVRGFVCGRCLWLRLCEGELVLVFFEEDVVLKKDWYG